MQLLRTLCRRTFPVKVGFPYDLPLIQNLETLEFPTPITFLVGDNGTGKSTLVESIALASQLRLVGHNQYEKHPFGPGITALGKDLKLTWSKKTKKGFFMSAESFFQFVLRIEEMKRESQADLALLDREYEGRSQFAKDLARSPHINTLGALQRDYGEGLDKQSHGEGFLTFFQQRFVGEGLYLLDEPETPLAPIRQLSLLAILADMVRQGGQFIIATHSPILLAYPDATIYHLDEAGIVQKDWEALEHVQIVRDFLNYPGPFLKELLD